MPVNPRHPGTPIDPAPGVSTPDTSHEQPAEGDGGVRCQLGDGNRADPDGGIRAEDAPIATGNDQLAPPGDMANVTHPAPDPTRKRLTPTERRVLSVYLETGNTRETAERCGVRGRVRPDAKIRGMLDRPHVRAALDEELRRLAPTEPELIAMLGRVASFDPATLAECYTEDASGRRRVDWARAHELGVSRMVRRVPLDRQGNETIEWRDVDGALALLAKVYGLTSDSTAVQVNVSTLSVEELRAIVDG